MKVYISFDFDRTLADYSKAHGNSILDGIHETYGNKFKVNWMDISSPGLTDLQIITYLVHNHGISYHTIFKNMNKVIRITDHKFHKYLNFYPVELLDKTEETLQQLSERENVVLGLSTGNIKSICLGKTKYTGIEDYFSFGAFGDEVYDRNRLLKLTKERLRTEYGLTKRDLILHVGDSILDITASIENNVIPIGVATGKYSKEDLYNAGAKYVFDKLPELNTELDTLLGSFQQKDQKLPVYLKRKLKTSCSFIFERIHQNIFN